MGGWIKLHRKVLDNEIWCDVTVFRLFTLLMLKATHQEMKVRGQTLKRGQYVRSYSKLAEDLAYKEGRGLKTMSKSTVMRAVKKLVGAGMLDVSETEYGTLFTVVNYDMYQGIGTSTSNDRDTMLARTMNITETNAGSKQALNELQERKEHQEQYHIEDGTLSQLLMESTSLANLFIMEIQKNDPNFKMMNKMLWAQQLQTFMQEQSRTCEEVAAVIRFAQQDEFERAIVLSPHKLIERFTSLLLKMRKSKKPVRRVEVVPEWFHERHAQPILVEEPPEMDFEAERAKIMKKLNR
ncbi:hypothetical protein ACIQ2D_03070 [Lysinibacillus sp. NPDC097287]|uniref:hypothetical protein n=1 Tax=Lysinibacillus sp. NPDC097287 TaxID=3364144 RepID=UPI00380A80DE